MMGCSFHDILFPDLPLKQRFWWVFFFFLHVIAVMTKFLCSFAALHEYALACPRKGMWYSLSAFAQKEKVAM